MKNSELREGGKKTPARLKAVINAIQFYDAEKLGFPLAEFRGKGSFQAISKGDTVDGACWPRIHGHRRYAKIYRVTAVRHTIEEKPDGTIKHLKSVFVEPAL